MTSPTPHPYDSDMTEPVKASAPAIPHGWKLVPVEPTDEWVAALQSVRVGSMKSVIADVLAAAPAPPAAAQEKAAPSDERIDALALECAFSGNAPERLEFRQIDWRTFARALLARYGAHPAAIASEACDHSEHVRPADGVCVECGEQVQPAASAEPPHVVAWRARDGNGLPQTDWIDGDPGPDMQSAWIGGDIERAYAAPVAAQAPAAAGDAQPVSRADELDAARYRWLRGHFRFAADSDCEIWFDSNLKHSPAYQLDAAIDSAMKRTSGGDHDQR